MALEELFWEANMIATQRIAILASHSEKWNESKHPETKNDEHILRVGARSENQDVNQIPACW